MDCRGGAFPVGLDCVPYGICLDGIPDMQEAGSPLAALQRYCIGEFKANRSLPPVSSAENHPKIRPNANI